MYCFPNLEPLCCSVLKLLLPDLHTDISGGRSGGLVFPSLSEFSTVYCDPHGQRLWHSQQSRCFSGTPLLSPWAHKCWQFDLWFLCLFKTQLVYLEFLVHVLLKPSLKDFKHYVAGMWNKCNCMVVWTFLSIALLWDCNENWFLSNLWPLLSFPNLLTY